MHTNTIEELRKLSDKAILLKEEDFLPKLDEKGTERELIEPFIEALGYKLGLLAGEVEPQPKDPLATTTVKCDYAIKKDGARIVLIEAKRAKVLLGAPDQLSAYFRQVNSSGVWLGIFTNGTEYRFYSGYIKENIKRMDSEPFLTLNLLEFDPAIAETVSTFAKGQFDPDEVRKLAKKRKFETAIHDALREELEEPSEELFQLLINKVGAEDEELERLRPLVKEVANQILNRPSTSSSDPSRQSSPGDNKLGIPIQFIDGGQIYKASLIQGGKVQLDDGFPQNPSGACRKLGRRTSYNGWNEWKYDDQQAGRKLPIDQLRELKDDEQIRRTGMSIGWIPKQNPRQYY